MSSFACSNKLGSVKKDLAEGIGEAAPTWQRHSMGMQQPATCLQPRIPLTDPGHLGTPTRGAVLAWPHAYKVTVIP